MQIFPSPRAGGPSVHIALVAPLAPGVAAAARQRVVAEKLPLALLDASVVMCSVQYLGELRMPLTFLDRTTLPISAQAPDLMMILTAAQRAILAEATGTMRARTVHTELLCQLSPRTNVGARCATQTAAR